MAIRQDLWISSEILRFTDVMHDCLDACRYLLKGLEPDTGVAIEKLTEINSRIRSHANAAKIHQVALNEFITRLSISAVRSALDSVGVDVQILKADIADMGNHGDYVYNNVLTKDHATMATYLDTNLPKFVSVRRRWAL